MEMAVPRKIPQQDFLGSCKPEILDWADKNRQDLLDYRAYRWLGLSYEDSRAKRDALEVKISNSLQENNGGLPLGVVNEIFMWGFGKASTFTNDSESLVTTKKAFEYLKVYDCYNACRTLMSIKGIGVAGSTKILGLSDQKKYCIYDSRVGLAVGDLRKDGKKLILTPPGRNIRGDLVSPDAWDHTWSWNYQKLIWTLEVALESFAGGDRDLRISDLEMSLFMKGARLRETAAGKRIHLG